MRQAKLLVAAVLLAPLVAVALDLEPPPEFERSWSVAYSTWAVAVDTAGHVYAAEQYNHQIRKYGSDGTLLKTWGTLGSGDGQLDNPRGVAVDTSGFVYVADYGNDRVQKFDGDGNHQMSWAVTDPRGIAVSATGNVYVVNTHYGRLEVFDNNGTLATSWPVGQVAGIAVDAGFVYVAGSHKIRKFDNHWTVVAEWGGFGQADGRLDQPEDVAVDANGDVYVADRNNNRVQKFRSDGTYVTKWGTIGWGDGQFVTVLGVDVDAAGNVYVLDSNRIQKFTPPVFNALSPEFVAPTSPESGSTFDWPAGKLLAFDIRVEDGDTDDIVTLEVVTLPVGAVVTPTPPLSDNPVQASFAWTPETADAGQHVVTLRATDEVDHETVFTFTVNVKDDSDGDGLSDLWEMEGYTAPNGEYVPLHQMGADPNHKDIFVDVDYMHGDAFNIFGTLLTFDHRPICAALDEIKATFAAAPVDNPDGTTGINLHIRVAQHADCSSPSVTSRVDFAPVLGSLDAASSYLWVAPPDSSVPHFDDLKGAPGIFPEELGYAVHYCVFAHYIAGSQTGISRGLDAGDFIVSLGSVMDIESALAGTPAGSTVTPNPETQAGTFIHELGHNLDLGHGGSDDLRQKPNYISIMNKDYFQMTGLLIDGEFGSIGGDHGSGSSRHYHFDYSREALPGWDGNVLDEAALDESTGLQGSAAMNRYGTYYYTWDPYGRVTKIQVNSVNDPIEWDVYGDLVAPFSMNVSNLDGINEAAGHDDWANVSYTGGRVGGGIVIPLPEATPADELTPEEAVEQVQTPAAVVGDLRGHVADKMLHLTWKPVGPGTIYRVYRREDGGDEVQIGTTTETNFKDKSVATGVVYTYTVKTYDPVHERESAVAEAVSLQLRR